MTTQQKQDQPEIQSRQPGKCVSNQESFMPTLRELARAYQAFNSYSDQHIRQMGLTSPQFDVIATLGGTAGMTMGEVAEKTLVTKGTLTGIIDRLVEKKLVQREVPEDNRRCCYVMLTTEGEQLYRQVFPAHVAHLKERFSKLDAAEVEDLRVLLKKLRQIF
jgi:MarR family transcriptional regulator, 2-MHQ and catechol-resistance regulon repressor